jgi:hypothetical protein
VAEAMGDYGMFLLEFPAVCFDFGLLPYIVLPFLMQVFQ